MVRHPSSAGTRPAFTLLEMLMAAAIAVLLMGAVYAALGFQYRLIQAGRDALEENLLARNLLNKMGNDIKLCVPLFISNQINVNTTNATGVGTTASLGATVASTGMAGSATSSTSGGTTASGSGSGTTGSGSGGTGTASSSTAAPSSGAIYNLGLQGDANHVVLFISRLPSELLDLPPSATSDQIPTGIADLRQVTYWLSAGGGLARRETTPVTSMDAAGAWVSLNDDPSCVIAPEVQSLQFSYFDGAQWLDTWDATALGPDNITPLGPPIAVQITITVPAHGKRAAANAGNVKTYVHRVAIPVANGLTPLATITGTTTGTGTTPP